VTNLVVGLDATANTDSVYAQLIPRLQGLPQQMTLKKWIDLAAYYKQVRMLFNGIFLFMGLVVFFMVLMSSVNTLLITMFERTREIGTMLAMGTPRFWVIALLMTEATLIGILGAIAGVLVANLLGALINASGLHMPPPPGYTVRVPFLVKHVPSLMIGSSLLVIVSLAMASIVPAIRASRLKIVEALAHV
jgi:putative ABC transport system permease protein